MAQMSAAPNTSPARVPTPPQPAVTARQPGPAAQNPWAPAPHLPVETGGCNQCAQHINPIYLHSDQDNSVSGGSVRGPASVRPPSAVPAPQLPQEQPECSIDCWIRQSENASEADGGRDQLFQDGAAVGAPPCYAGSVASTLYSREGHPLNKALKNLQKAILKILEKNPDHKGKNQISH